MLVGVCGVGGVWVLIFYLYLLCDVGKWLLGFLFFFILWRRRVIVFYRIGVEDYKIVIRVLILVSCLVYSCYLVRSRLLLVEERFLGRRGMVWVLKVFLSRVSGLCWILNLVLLVGVDSWLKVIVFGVCGEVEW